MTRIAWATRVNPGRGIRLERLIRPRKRISPGPRVSPGEPVVRQRKLADSGQRARGRSFGRRRSLASRRGSPQIRKLPAEGGYLDIALSNRQCYPVERLVGRLHAVAPDRRGRAEQSDVGCRRDVGVERRPVGRKLRQLTATTERSGDHPAEDHGGYGEQDYGHSMNRAMLGRMVMSAGVARLPAATALMAVAGSLAEASAAVAAGADLIDLGAATPETITAFRSRHPGIPVCAAGSPADVVRDAAVARVTGAMLLCGDADAALDSGIPSEQVLVDVRPATMPEVCQGGLATLVDVDRGARLAAQHNAADRDLAGRDLADRESAGFGLMPVAEIVALAALSSWLGASMVRTSYPAQVRQALDMTASVRGTRRPARTVRGLA